MIIMGVVAVYVKDNISLFILIAPQPTTIGENKTIKTERGLISTSNTKFFTLHRIHYSGRINS